MNDPYSNRYRAIIHDFAECFWHNQSNDFAELGLTFIRTALDHGSFHIQDAMLRAIDGHCDQKIALMLASLECSNPYLEEYAMEIIRDFEKSND